MAGLLLDWQPWPGHLAVHVFVDTIRPWPRIILLIIVLQQSLRIGFVLQNDGHQNNFGADARKLRNMKIILLSIIL